MTLDVMIVTTAARVGSIRPLPRVEGVRYIISVQDPQFALKPEDLTALNREDIEVRIYHDSGSSNNRNHALEAATADIAMAADDDLTFFPDGLREVIRTFEENPDLDWITTRAEIDEQRVYPPAGWNLAETFRFYTPITFEIAFRRAAVPPQLRFSPLVGIGAPFLSNGEDDLFFHHLRRSGLKGQFRPIKAVAHPGPTTHIHSAATPSFVRTKGAMMFVVRGAFPALIRIPLEAKRSPIPSPKALAYLLQGFFYAAKHRREL